METTLFDALKEACRRPAVFTESNSTTLWNDPHISTQMLKFHLNPDNDPASRNRAFMTRSIHWIIEEFQLDAHKSVLDLGCGPGLYTIDFAKTGAKVTGIDVSTNSIEYAKQKATEENLAITYLNADYVACDFPGRYDLVTMIYDDFCVLSPASRSILLGKIHAALKDAGVFLFDVLSPHHYAAQQEQQSLAHAPQGGFWSPVEHYVLSSTFLYEPEKVVLEKNVVVEPDRVLTICNYLQCFTLEAIRQELSEHGFRVDASYGDVAGTPYDGTTREFALAVGKM